MEVFVLISLKFDVLATLFCLFLDISLLFKFEKFNLKKKINYLIKFDLVYVKI